MVRCGVFYGIVKELDNHLLMRHVFIFCLEARSVAVKASLCLANSMHLSIKVNERFFFYHRKMCCYSLPVSKA